MPNLNKILLHHVVFLCHLYGILRQSSIRSLRLCLMSVLQEFLLTIAVKKSFISEHTFITIQVTSFFSMCIVSGLYVHMSYVQIKHTRQWAVRAITVTVVISWLHLIHNLLPRNVYRKKVKFVSISKRGIAYIHTFQRVKIYVKIYFNISLQSKNVTWIPLYHNSCRSTCTRNMYQEMHAENKMHIQCGVRNNCGGGMK